MPLFGLIPYNDEEKRRRRLLTEEDNYAPPPPALPEISGRRPSLSAAGSPESVTPPTLPSRRPSRLEEMNEAKDVYMRKTPGRARAGLLGGLQALGQGGSQDLGQTVGQGLGGLIGGLIDPKGVREAQFNQRVRPQIMDRFAAEDQERAGLRQAEQDALGVELKRAQIGQMNRANMPEPPKRPSLMDIPRGVFDPETRMIIPGTEPLPAAPKPPAPRYVVNERGEYVDVAGEAAAGRKVKAFQKPKATGGGGKAKKESKVVSRSQVEKAADEHFGGDDSEAAAAFVRKGYRIVN